MAASAIKAFVFDWAGTMIDFGCCAPVVALQGAFAEADAAVARQAGEQVRLALAGGLALLAACGRDPTTLTLTVSPREVELKAGAYAASIPAGDHSLTVEVDGNAPYFKAQCDDASFLGD